jgi:ribonucleoside-diphosphate reductase alpha chain
VSPGSTASWRSREKSTAAEKLGGPEVRPMDDRFTAQNRGVEIFEQGLLNEQLSEYSGDAPTCPTCGQFTIRSGSCYRCLYCGESLGCS